MNCVCGARLQQEQGETIVNGSGEVLLELPEWDCPRCGLTYVFDTRPSL